MQLRRNSLDAFFFFFSICMFHFVDVNYNKYISWKIKDYLKDKKKDFTPSKKMLNNFWKIKDFWDYSEMLLDIMIHEGGDRNFCALESWGVTLALEQYDYRPLDDHSLYIPCWPQKFLGNGTQNAPSLFFPEEGIDVDDMDDRSRVIYPRRSTKTTPSIIFIALILHRNFCP